jgi:hypothetical protein
MAVETGDALIVYFLYNEKVEVFLKSSIRHF